MVAELGTEKAVRLSTRDKRYDVQDDKHNRVSLQWENREKSTSRGSTSPINEEKRLLFSRGVQIQKGRDQTRPSIKVARRW